MISNPFKMNRYAVMGYACSIQEINDIRHGLRAGPGVTALLALAGVCFQSPWPLLIGGAISWICSLFGTHPADILVNIVWRIRNKAALPVNPAPRRFSCGFAGVVGLSSGLLMLTGYPLIGLSIALFVGVVSVFVSFTNLCVGAYIYQLGDRAQSLLRSLMA